MHNKHANASATLSLKADVPDNAVDMKVVERTLRDTTAYLVNIDSLDEQD